MSDVLTPPVQPFDLGIKPKLFTVADLEHFPSDVPSGPVRLQRAQGLRASNGSAWRSRRLSHRWPTAPSARRSLRRSWAGDGRELRERIPLAATRSLRSAMRPSPKALRSEDSASRLHN